MSPSGSTTDASGTRPVKKNTRGPCRQLKTGKVTWVTNDHLLPDAVEVLEDDARGDEDYGAQSITNYNLEHMDEDKFVYVNWLFSERYKQWKSNLHQWFEEFDDPQVALEEGCPKELEDRQDSWVWLCDHFTDPTYVKNAKANKINREKKTILHHLGSRPFSYRMEA
ncbi:hypothetical protein C1H46_000573 [Malus baccata]|uniref:Uncharacterized protein n=1 Tax=Malus baccata TaxID=106549 RepID=A0A540NSC6_MALBA|nr:hypothetical protein C1H46_000573 [Malus baccata]